jgi:triosephosphate isomerase
MNMIEQKLRVPIVAGNWKLNKTVPETCRLIVEMLPGLQAVSGVEKVLFPPFPSLMVASILLEGTEVQLGAQNMFWETKGAFTGEVSPVMLKDFCHYVILGHSERRKYFSETDQDVNRKVQVALEHNLIPIICIGETLEENEAGRAAEILANQVKGCLSDVSVREGRQVVIAYEPVWAIGTGRAATAEGANLLIRNVIRQVMAGILGETIAQSVRVLYGGSVNPENAAEFFMKPEIDGALVGGASLNADDFVSIVEATSQV